MNSDSCAWGSFVCSANFFAVFFVKSQNLLNIPEMLTGTAEGVPPRGVGLPEDVDDDARLIATKLILSEKFSLFNRDHADALDLYLRHNLVV